MAKKDLNEDILSGGSISGSAKSDKSAKKAERLAQKAKKIAEKNAALDKEIQELRSKLTSATDEKEKMQLRKSWIKQKQSRMLSAEKNLQSLQTTLL